MARTNPSNLTDLQWRFVREYLVDLNATAAYQRAGYRASGHAAESAASRLLRNVEVAAAIASERERLVQEEGITPEKVLREWARIGFSDMRHYATWGPSGVTLKASSDLSDDAALAVAEVSETVGEHTHTVRFKLHSKMEALNSLGKHFDLFKEQATARAVGAGLAALLTQAKGQPDADQ